MERDFSQISLEGQPAWVLTFSRLGPHDLGVPHLAAFHDVVFEALSWHQQAAKANPQLESARSQVAARRNLACFVYQGYRSDIDLLYTPLPQVPSELVRAKYSRSADWLSKHLAADAAREAVQVDPSNENVRAFHTALTELDATLAPLQPRTIEWGRVAETFNRLEAAQALATPVSWICLGALALFVLAMHQRARVTLYTTLGPGRYSLLAATPALLAAATRLSLIYLKKCWTQMGAMRLFLHRQYDVIKNTGKAESAAAFRTWAVSQQIPVPVAAELNTYFSQR